MTTIRVELTQRLLLKYAQVSKAKSRVLTEVRVRNPVSEGRQIHSMDPKNSKNESVAAE